MVSRADADEIQSDGCPPHGSSTTSRTPPCLRPAAPSSTTSRSARHRASGAPGPVAVRRRAQSGAGRGRTQPRAPLVLVNPAASVGGAWRRRLTFQMRPGCRGSVRFTCAMAPVTFMIEGVPSFGRELTLSELAMASLLREQTSQGRARLGAETFNSFSRRVIVGHLVRLSGEARERDHGQPISV
jgi:hypothetical protein